MTLMPHASKISSRRVPLGARIIVCWILVTVAISMQCEGMGLIIFRVFVFCFLFFVQLLLSVFAFDHNRSQTTVYIAIWLAYGLYPLPNWLTKFYQEKECQEIACPNFLLLCLKRICLNPCGTRRQLTSL